MARKPRRPTNDDHRRPVEAPVLGSSRLTDVAREQLTHADPAPQRAVPKDNEVEAGLARAEDLLGRGHFGPALREAQSLETAGRPLDGRYAFVRQEKIARAQIGIAERYVTRGDQINARLFYELALRPDGADPAVREIAALGGRVFDELLSQRRNLMRELRANVQAGQFDGWCGRKRVLETLTVVDVAAVRERIAPDFRLEQVFGERPPLRPQPGYLDPFLVEDEPIAFASAMPGAVFRALGEEPVDVDRPPVATPDVDDGRLRGSLVSPLFAGILAAKAGLFALDNGLDVAGRADGTLPRFRYEHLRDHVKELIAQIQTIESRMLPIQLELDDFAEVVDAIRRPLASREAELVAVRQRIGELTELLAQLAQIEQALDDVVDAIEKIEDECECDWFCWLTVALMGVFSATVFAFFVALAVSLGPLGLAAVSIAGGALVGALVIVTLETYESFTCDNVTVVGRTMRTSLAGVRTAIAESEAELIHALATRDILIATINALKEQLEEVYRSNAARVLDAKTLDAIQAQYNNLRQSMLSRAHAVARLAQSAFNFERDTDARLLRHSYVDADRKGYTAAETLLHDLGGYDLIDLTGRTQKAMQLNQMVSLRQHAPISFLALAATRGARFTTTLADFDRWYPGTYQQRIKEVRVEVLVDGAPVPARGYLANDGVSLVRFADSENRRPIDDKTVFAEPDEDIARLCYKRLQRRRHVDTMAFPEFTSYLHEERMRELQARERNFFENVGLESTWVIEFLPDQPIDLARISDVRVWFQYEALFDENLKRVQDAKRHVGRRLMAAVPIGRTVAGADPPDFSAPQSFRTSPTLFEAPALEKTIIDAGVAIRLKGGRKLEAAATLEVAYAEAPPVTVTTDPTGIVATAPEHPAGSGLTELAAMVRGKSAAASWTVRLAGLPTGLGPVDVDELFLLLSCEYATPSA